MKHITFLDSNKKEYLKAKTKANNKKYKSKLIQIFTALNDIKKIQKLLNKIHQDFPDALVLGTTSAGEISHAKMYDDSTVISISLFETTKLNSSYVKNIDTHSGLKLSKNICSTNTKAAIVLSEGLKGKDYEGFIKGIKKQNPELIIAGGLAGDNFALKETFVFLGTKIFSEGAVAVSFSSKKLYADNRYNLNWTPIGKEFTITSSEGNIVHEIDNESSVEIFKRYLGEELFKNNAISLPDFQLLYKEGGTTVSRTPMAVDGHSLVFAAPLKVGQKVQFGFSNATTVLSGSELINKKISKNPAEAIYVFSCIARKTLLGKRLESEFNSFESIAPTAGFFTYGEFYSTSVNNALLNCTTTILVLSEASSKPKTKKTLKVNTSSLDSVTFSALTHFVKQTALELNHNVELLNQYKNVVDQSSLVSKTDKNGLITYVNDNFCRISQSSKAELLGKNHNIVRDEAMSNFIFKKMWLTITEGKVWKGILSNKSKDGSTYYVDATIMPIFGKNGEIQEYIAIRQDITKQIQSKKRIKEKEKLIKAIFDNQDSIVIYASKNDGMLSVNQKLFEYFDFVSFEEFRNKHNCICELFLDEEGYVHPQKDVDWLETVINTPKVDHKTKMLTKFGEVKTFHLSVKKIENEYIINLSDITNLENALQKAYSSEQAKSAFLANMSHEIRTPLNGILGFTDVLRNKDLDKDTARYIDIIHKSGQTLLHVVNDVLDFSKIESGELSISKTEANLFKEMEATVATFASLAKKKHIDFHTFIDTNMPKILKLDVQRLKQVVNNLISNALKFTPENGEVNVNIKLDSIKDNKAIITFSVTDSGIGIAEDKIATIFNSFSQADDSISRKYGGTGLGLAISKKYIDLMDASLMVESKEGQGSTFYFTLENLIIDNTKALKKESSLSTININLLTSKNDISCAVNNIVSTYLNTWGCSVKEISEVAEVDDSTEILVVCAKLFDDKTCKSALDKYENLQLIYIEGSQDNFSCSHPKFHLVNQPMTGSALFDILITLSTSPESIVLKESINSQTNLFKGNILVAEDNETNQMLIEVMLSERGLNFKIANDGQEALDEINSNDIYDIIFMDINMPVLDGISTTKILRKNGYTKPIISLSANVIESDIKSFLDAGVDDTLNKPIVPNDLDNILKKYLSEQVELKDEFDFDTIDINKISKSLSIKNLNIIKKLLKTFVSTSEEMIDTLASNNIDESLLHTLKGVSGNLRFSKIYKLSMDLEETFESWSEVEYEVNKKLLLAHLEELNRQILLINS